MGGKSSKNTTTTKTTSDPWSGVQPYLKEAYGKAHKYFLNNQGGPTMYDGDRVADMNNMEKSALNEMYRRGSQGSRVTDQAQNMAAKTMRGDFLSAGNPYMKGAINAATRPVVENYQKNIVPGLDSQFAGAGRYGSGAHAMASTDAANDLSRNIGDISSQMAYQNYGDERNNMMKAGILAPELANQDYKDINAMGQAGQGFANYSQANINDKIAKHDFYQNRHWNMMDRYLGMLNGATGGSSTTSQTAPSQRPNPFTSGLGGALAGGSMFGPWGALAGGGLGLLGSFF